VGTYKYFKKEQPDFSKEEIEAIAILEETELKVNTWYTTKDGKKRKLVEIFWPYKCINKYTEWFEGEPFKEGSVFHTLSDSSDETKINYCTMHPMTKKITYKTTSVQEFVEWIGWKKGKGIIVGEPNPKREFNIPESQMAQLKAAEQKNIAAKETEKAETSKK
jgi:hypothetical protein